MLFAVLGIKRKDLMNPTKTRVYATLTTRKKARLYAKNLGTVGLAVLNDYHFWTLPIDQFNQVYGTHKEGCRLYIDEDGNLIDDLKKNKRFFANLCSK